MEDREKWPEMAGGAELHSKPFFNISWGCKLRLQFIMTLLFIYICFAPLYHHFLLSIPLLHHHPTIINFASCRLPFFPFSILLSLYPTTFAPQSTHLPHCQPKCPKLRFHCMLRLGSKWLNALQIPVTFVLFSTAAGTPSVHVTFLDDRHSIVQHWLILLGTLTEPIPQKWPAARYNPQLLTMENQK